MQCSVLLSVRLFLFLSVYLPFFLLFGHTRWSIRLKRALCKQKICRDLQLRWCRKARSLSRAHSHQIRYHVASFISNSFPFFLFTVFAHNLSFYSGLVCSFTFSNVSLSFLQILLEITGTFLTNSTASPVLASLGSGSETYKVSHSNLVMPKD